MAFIGFVFGLLSCLVAEKNITKTLLIVNPAKKKRPQMKKIENIAILQKTWSELEFSFGHVKVL